jgi:hypothetical protein
MVVGHWANSQHRDSRILSSSPWNTWSIEHNHALYWKFGILAGLGSRPQSQMTMSSVQKTFLVLTPFEGALTCSHSKIHVVDFTFMVRRINENSLTLSACVFLRWFHDSDRWFYVSGAFYLKNNFGSARDSNPRPLRTLFSIKTPNRNLTFSAMPLLEN